MKLDSVKAIRYGALEGECLSGLSDGLTVVLGPNESGKSTMTALTRHVLYGYPDGRAKEHGYVPNAGARDAQLVFSDASGEWVIERVDGKNRGPVTVSAVRGAERSGLLSELVGGVSEQSYRVVFGFGLDELALIESSDSADIASQLYAAGFGLAVNPMDARKQLESAAAELYSPRAQKPMVNSLAAKMREVKSRIARLEAEAAGFAGDQARLSQLADELEPLRTDRDRLEMRLAVLEQEAAQLARAGADVEGLTRELSDQELTIKDAERAVEMVDVDERILAAAPELTSVLEDASAFRTHLDAIAAAEASAEESERRATAKNLPVAAVDSVENRTAVESWRDRLPALQARRQSTEDVARATEARAQATARAVESAEASTPGSVSRTLPVAFAAVIIVTGALFATLGFVQHQTLAAVLGGAVAAIGAAALVLAFVRKPGPASPAESFSADSVRLGAEAKAARSIADAAGTDVTSARDEWRAWLAERSLDSQGDDPAAVRALLDELAERERLLGEARQYSAAARRERDAAEAWVVRLVDAVRRYDESAAQIPALSEAGALAARARHDLDSARRAETERAELVRGAQNAKAERDRLAERLEATRAVVAEIATREGLGGETPVAELAALVERTREARDLAREAFERISAEHAELRGKLKTEGRDDAMARARQELEGLRVRAAEAADRYLVETLAVRLLDRARERFESERQPEVVRTAGRVFSAMTEGRYIGVRVPLDGSGVSVVTAGGDVRPTGELSRGTAEQLYLALRIGLIGSLGTTGESLPVLMDDVIVNFDPERRDGAVAAVAALSEMHQVLFFTCHPETASALASAVAGAKMLSLDRCELR